MMSQFPWVLPLFFTAVATELRHFLTQVRHPVSTKCSRLFANLSPVNCLGAPRVVGCFGH